jgi:biotin carboxyl carrier protein
VQYEVEVNGRLLHVNVHRMNRHFVVAVDGREWTVNAARIDRHTLSLLVGASSHEVTLVSDQASGQLVVSAAAVPLWVTVNGRRRWGRRDESGSGGGPQHVIAPMPGKIVRLLAQPGTAVHARQPLVVIEAMKMENELRATRPGVVTQLLVHEGQSVDAGVLLLIVAPE